jgi:signal peptidase I
MRRIARTAALAAGVAAAASAGRWLARAGPPLRRFAVEGDSMLPAFRHGDRVLVWAWAYRSRPPAPGDVVVVRDPERADRVLIKRVASPPLGAPAGHLYVLGDNEPMSRDSRCFGALPRSAVIGRVLWRY